MVSVVDYVYGVFAALPAHDPDLEAVSGVVESVWVGEGAEGLACGHALELAGWGYGRSGHVVRWVPNRVGSREGWKIFGAGGLVWSRETQPKTASVVRGLT